MTDIDDDECDGYTKTVGVTGTIGWLGEKVEKSDEGVVEGVHDGDCGTEVVHFFREWDVCKGHQGAGKHTERHELLRFPLLPAFVPLSPLCRTHLEYET